MKVTAKIIYLLIFIFLIFSCKQNIESKKNQSLSNKKDSLIINTTKKEANKEQHSVTYFYKDNETNDSQKVIINWNDDTSFNFKINVDNDMCQFKDKGEAFLQNNLYSVKNHTVLKKIKFNIDKTEVQLICEYGKVRDECDPVEEFIMILTSK